MTFLVHINDSPYAVPDADIADVELRILAAVHSGGGFVDVEASGARTARVMVSPASRVRIERVPEAVEPSEQYDLFPDYTFFDLDL